MDSNALGLAHFINHRHRVGIRLPVDVDQRRRMSVSCHHRVFRLNPDGNGSNICDGHRRIVDRGYDDAVELVGLFCLAADERQFKLMILVNQSRRDDDVRGSNCVRDLLD